MAIHTMSRPCFLSLRSGGREHQFVTAVQQLVDVLLCARAPVVPSTRMCLRAVGDRCGVTGAIVAALDLAGRTFDDAACRALTSALRPIRFRKSSSRSVARCGAPAPKAEGAHPFPGGAKAFRQTLRYSSRCSTKRGALAKRQEVQADAAFARMKVVVLAKGADARCKAQLVRR